MNRFFNIAGPCNAQKHYMLPARDRCADILSLIDQEQFFVIHAARQSGKTTLLQDAARVLNEQGRYHALYCSLESVQEVTDPREGIPAILDQFESVINFAPAVLKDAYPQNTDRSRTTSALKETLASFCAALDKPLVLLLDEADCLANGTLITFLRQLRDGYVNRSTIPFVHSLALVGMRDIRDYKARVREGRTTLGSASPFNIVTESLTIRNFTREEVGRLYAQHTEATGQAFPDDLVAAVFEKTQGQPWLVNAVAREIIVKLLENDTTRAITPGHAEQAIETLILRRDTHIDSLIERLKEERVRRIVEPVILGKEGAVDRIDDDCRYVLDLGLLRDDKGTLLPANPIYGDVMIRMLNYNSQYDLPVELENRWMDGEALDMNGLLDGFQQFWRENSEVWSERYQYREAAPHLILMAYLQRVLNGGGHILREFASGRKRLDLCVQYRGRNYPIELKLRYSDKATADGIEQLSGYMDTLGTDEGWLIVFDRRPDLSWDEKIFRRKEKTIDGRGAIHLLGC